MTNPLARLAPAPNWLIERPIAHRALHDMEDGRAENSIRAFRAAVNAGYAIECDLQVSATGEPVVFHDPDLVRMTGLEGTVRSRSPAQLAEMRLGKTADGIHTLREHLQLVDRAVPIVLELKGVEGEDSGFVEGVADSIRDYEGPLAVMSFDHWICAQFADLMPHVPRGLTAEGSADDAARHTGAMPDFDLQFISYGVKDLPTPFIADAREAGLPVITWTVRNERDVRATFAHADQMTFEGFLPPADRTQWQDG